MLKLQKLVRPAIVALPAGGLIGGIAMQLSGWSAWSGWIWAAATIPVLLVLVAEIRRAAPGSC